MSKLLEGRYQVVAIKTKYISATTVEDFN